MIKIIRNFIVSAAAGFMIPTLASAAITEPPSVAKPHYLFTLSYEDVEGAVGFALAEKGAGNKVAATVIGRKQDALFSYDKPITVEIRGLQFDKPSSRWSASLLIVNEGTAVSALPVSGRFEEMTEIAVLKRQVRAGDIIEQKDVEIRDYATSRTRSDTITDIASLVGKSPVRTISAGRPIYEQEIAKPVIVEKNSIVRMHYRNGSMAITATGTAEESGSKGSIINVRNIDSRKLVRAVVEDAGTVSIITPSTQTHNLSGESRHAVN